MKLDEAWTYYEAYFSTSASNKGELIDLAKGKRCLVAAVYVYDLHAVVSAVIYKYASSRVYWEWDCPQVNIPPRILSRLTLVNEPMRSPLGEWWRTRSSIAAHVMEYLPELKKDDIIVWPSIDKTFTVPVDGYSIKNTDFNRILHVPFLIEREGDFIFSTKEAVKRPLPEPVSCKVFDTAIACREEFSTFNELVEKLQEQGMIAPEPIFYKEGGTYLVCKIKDLYTLSGRAVGKKFIHYVLTERGLGYLQTMFINSKLQEEASC